jgi:hypothetical protein
VKDPARKKNAYTCDRPPKGVGISGDSTKGSSNNLASGTANYDSCASCLSVTGKGYVTTTGKCESGSVTGSTESDSNPSKGNWISFLKEKTKTDWVSVKLAPSGSLSCESLPKTSTTSSPSTSSSSNTLSVAPTPVAKVYDDVGTDEICAKYVACGLCTLLNAEYCGWDSSANKCKHGKSTESDDGKATTKDGNWIWFIDSAHKSREGGDGLTCV